jgi:hypothetical protein
MNANELIAHFNACCTRNYTTLVDGRVYRCPFSAHAIRLGAVPEDHNDYIELKDATPGQLRVFLRHTHYLDTCAWCDGRPFGAPEIPPAVQL